MSAAAIRPISNGRLSTTASIKSAPRPSYVIENDALQLVGNVVEAIHDLFQVIVDLVAGDVVHRLGFGAGIEILQPPLMHLVGLSFEMRNLLGDLAYPR